MSARPRAHSFGSNRSSSRSSSVGPDSFTENLTDYIKGARIHEPSGTRAIHGADNDYQSIAGPEDLTENLTDYIKGVSAVQSAQPVSREVADAAVQTTSEEPTTIDNDNVGSGTRQEEVQALRDELQATLKRHDEVVAENKWHARELSQMRDGAAKSAEAARRVRAAEDKSGAETAILNAKEALKRDFEERIGDLEHELREQQLDASRKAAAQGETIDKLTWDVAKQLQQISGLTSLTQDQSRQLEEQPKQLEVQPERADKRDSDPTRIKELQSQLREVNNAKLKAVEDARVAKTSSMHDQHALQLAESRIELLEEQVAERDETDSEDEDRPTHGELEEQVEKAGEAQAKVGELEAALKKAAQYVHKLLGKQKDLKSEAAAADNECHELQNQVNGLQLQVAGLQSAGNSDRDDLQSLRREVEELRSTKKVMSNVLMYEWGRKEVGEVERPRKDGKLERGMGYRYKYVNRDGTLRDER